MKTDGTFDEQPKESYPAAHILTIAKRALFVCMLLFPAAVLGVIGIEQWIYNRQPRSKADAPQNALPDASTFEQPVLDGIGPAIVKKYDLKDFEVKYLQSTLRIRIGTAARDARRVRVGQAFAIMEDIRKLRRSTPSMPTCAWALEIDHDAPDGGMTFVLPDTVHGYEADSHWHNAALYEDAPDLTGKEARP